MVSASSYLIAALQLAALVGALAWSAYRLRVRLLPDWQGAPGRLVESILGVTLLIWLAELLGLFGLLYAGTLIAASALVAVATTFLSAGGAVRGGSRTVTGPAVERDQ